MKLRRKKYKIEKVEMTPRPPAPKIEKEEKTKPTVEEVMDKADKIEAKAVEYIKTNTLVTIDDETYSQILIDKFEEESGKNAIWRNKFTKQFKDWIDIGKNAIHDKL